MPGCEFDIKTSITVVQHEFNRSWSRGVRAIGEELTNVFSRVREIQAPTSASFNLTYEVHKGRLYWPGDRLSVEAHMRRNIVWLKANGGTESQLDQARLDLLVFREVQERTLLLSDGQAVMWMAQKTTEPTDGVAIQQIRRDGDQLIQNSQLLSFDQQSQIDNFIDWINEGRADVSVAEGVGGWVVEGKALNFEQELPDLIDQTYQAELSIDLPLTQLEPIDWQAFPEIITTDLITPTSFLAQTEKPIESVITVATATGFWFEVMAAAAEPEATEVLLSRSDLEVQKITKVEDIIPTRSNPAAIILEDKKTVVKSGKIDPIEKPREKSISTRRDLVGKQKEKVKTVTRLHSVIIREGKDKRNEAVSNFSITKTSQLYRDTEKLPIKSLGRRSTKTVFVGQSKVERRRIVFQATAPEPSVYNLPEWVLASTPVNDKEIPAWTMNFDLIDDFTIFILSSFWLILNTIPRRIPVWRGSGRWPQMAVVYPS